MAGISRRHFLAAAAIPRVLSGQEAQSVFDGKSLAGWSVQDGPEAAFTVANGTILGTPSSGYPAWLRSAKRYENFDLRLEFALRGWTDGGLYFHAPEHGRRTWSGFKVSIFHQQDKEPRTNSMGSIFPIIAPRVVNVRSRGEWNALRVLMDWPSLRVWSNEELIHDLDVERHADLRYRLRSGYLGLETLSYPIRFRNLSVRELAGKEKWDVLYDGASGLEKWTVAESNQRSPARFTPQGPVLRAEGLGVLATKEKYRDFAFQCYVRGSRHHNGGILFRGEPRYEIQLHDVEEAHYPTGSLYSFQRATYPRISAEEWFLYQMWVEGKRCVVRINGENVMEYDRLENLVEAPIGVQAHDAGRWVEYKEVRVRRL